MNKLLKYFLLIAIVVHSADWYAGKTSEGYGIGFKVTGSTVDSIAMKYYAYNGSNSYLGVYTANHNANATISGGNFTEQRVFSDTSTFDDNNWKWAGTLSGSGASKVLTSSEGIVWSEDLGATLRKASTSSPPTFTANYIGTTNTISAPKSVSASTYNSTYIKLTYDTHPNAYQYQIYRSTSYFGTYSYVGTTTSSSTYYAGSLNPGTYYYFKIRGVSIWGSGSYSSPSGAYTKPATPSGLGVIGFTENGLYVYWSSQTPVDNYIVYRSTSLSGTYTAIDTVSNNYLYDYSGASNTTYYYKISALANGLESSRSTGVGDRTFLSTPINFVGQSINSTTLNLSWSSLDGASNYLIYRSNTHNGSYNIIDSTTSTSFYQYSLSSNTAYYYKIRARNSDGDLGTLSSYISLTTAPAVPGAPSLSDVAVLVNRIEWNTSAGATSYDVQEWNGQWDSIATVTDTFYHDMDLPSVQTKYYRVRARSSAGASSYGSYSSLVVGAATFANTPYFENFDSGSVSASWYLYSTHPSGQSELSTNYSPQGSYHILMAAGAANGINHNNEAILAINLGDGSNVDLFFDHKEFNDADNILPSSYTGYEGGDGIAYSNDGHNWYKVQGLTSSESISSSYKEFYVDLDSLGAVWGISLAGNGYLKLLHEGSSSLPSNGFAFDNVRLSPKFSVNTLEGANGATLPSNSFYSKYGDTHVLYFTPDEGYEISLLILNGDTLGVEDSLEIGSIVENQLVETEFKLKEYTLSFISNTGGSFEWEGDSIVEHGTSWSNLLTVSKGYQLDTLLINESSQVDLLVSEDSTYEAYNVSAEFSIIPVEIIQVYSENGSLYVNDALWPLDTLVDYGESYSFEIRPVEGYEVDSVFLNDLYQGETDSLIVDSVVSEKEIRVTYKRIQLTVDVLNGPGGSSNIEGTQSVYWGDSLLIIPDANIGHHLDSILIDSVKIVLVDTLLILDIESSQQVKFYYGPNDINVNVSINTGGTSTLVGDSLMKYGESFSLSLTPDEDYRVSDLVINGGSVGAADEWSIDSLIEGIVIVATFDTIPDTLWNMVAKTTINGSIIPSDTTQVIQNGNLDYTFIPDLGYELDSVWVDGIYSGANDFYSFNEIVTDHEIDASYKLKKFEITGISDSHFVWAGLGDYEFGSSVDLIPLAVTGYEMDSLFVNGSLIGLMDTIRVDSLKIDYEVRGVSTKQAYDIEVVNVGAGSVSPSGAFIASYGDSLGFTVSPDEGFQIKSIEVNGESIANNTSFNLIDIDTAYTINVQFETIPLLNFSITVASGLNGEFNVEGVVLVEQGSEQSFSVVPHLGYELDTLLIDGILDTINQEVNFVDVEEDHSIYASFKKKIQTVSFNVTEGVSLSNPIENQLEYGDNLETVFDLSFGYEIDKLKINNEDIAIVDTLVLENVIEDLIVEVQVKKKSAIFFVEYTPLGNANFSNETNANFLDTLNLVLSPNRGYELSALVIDDDTIVSPSLNQIIIIEKDTVSVVPIFSLIKLRVQTNSEENISISVIDTLIDFSSPLSINLLAYEGYDFVGWYTSDSLLSTIDTLEIASVEDDYQITAILDTILYQLSIEHTEGGQLGFVGDTMVFYGDDFVSYSEAIEGYKLDSITLNDTIIPNADTLRISEFDNSNLLSYYYSRIQTEIILEENSDVQILYLSEAPFYWGDTLEYTLDLGVSKELDSLYLNGVKVEIRETYKTLLIDSLIVTPFYSQKQIEIMVSPSIYGFSDPNENTAVNWGGSFEIKYFPKPGYEIEGVMVGDSTYAVVDSVFKVDSINTSLNLVPIYKTLSVANDEVLIELFFVKNEELIKYETKVINKGDDLELDLTSILVGSEVSEIIMENKSLTFGETLIVENIEFSKKIELFLVESSSQLYSIEKSKFIDQGEYVVKWFDLNGSLIREELFSGGLLKNPNRSINAYEIYTNNKLRFRGILNGVIND